MDDDSRYYKIYMEINHKTMESWVASYNYFIRRRLTHIPHTTKGLLTHQRWGEGMQLTRGMASKLSDIAIKKKHTAHASMSKVNSVSS